MKKTIGVLSLTALAPAAFASMQIVAAENFYGDVAKTIGGTNVTVYSIMNNPNQDPQMFSASPKVATLIDNANITIESGVDYDPWMENLYASSSKKAFMINVGNLIGKASGANLNPHIWYDPKTMPVFAKALTQELCRLDPTHEQVYQQNLQSFLKTADAYQQKITSVRSKTAGISITATEPVFGYLATALRLNMLNTNFQWDVMNGTDLSPKEVTQFETSLNDKTAKLLVYNNQVTDPTTENIKTLALKNHIPVVGVSETMPTNTHYYEWMNSELNAVAGALEPSEHD